MTVTRLDRTEVEALWAEHARGVRHFLFGVLRDPDAAEEVLQQTFVTVLERGHTAARTTRKGWIYRVAFHHAVGSKRRDRRGQRATDVVRDAARLDPPLASSTIDAVERDESIARVRSAITELPATQREIVELRLGAAKTFQTIADELGIPLSTALTRMRLATEKLRQMLES